MIRRLPLVPTLIVALAVAVMIGLGVWQLSRAAWKDALIRDYAGAPAQPPIAFPAMVDADHLPLFRRATGLCLQPTAKRVTAGRSRADEPGFVHIVQCRTGAEGPGMAVQIGWSKDPNATAEFRGGAVSGLIAPDGQALMRLVADPPAAGLQASAAPSVAAIPNNHRSYAVQWFLFAAAALVIYALAVRKKLAEPPK